MLQMFFLLLTGSPPIIDDPMFYFDVHIWWIHTLFTGDRSGNHGGRHWSIFMQHIFSYSAAHAQLHSALLVWIFFVVGCLSCTYLLVPPSLLSSPLCLPWFTTAKHGRQIVPFSPCRWTFKVGLEMLFLHCLQVSEVSYFCFTALIYTYDVYTHQHFILLALLCLLLISVFPFLMCSTFTHWNLPTFLSKVAHPLALPLQFRFRCFIAIYPQFPTHELSHNRYIMPVHIIWSVLRIAVIQAVNCKSAYWWRCEEARGHFGAYMQHPVPNISLGLSFCDYSAVPFPPAPLSIVLTPAYIATLDRNLYFLSLRRQPASRQV